MIAPPLIRSSNQGRALLCGYLAFSVAYLGSASLGIGPPRMLQPGHIETSIPLLEWTIWIYLTQFLLLPAAILLARDDRERSRTFYAMLVATVLAAFVFIVWPTELERPTPQPDGLTGLAWTLLYSTDTPCNCFPSLHVALATVAGMSLWRCGRRAIAWLWPLLIAVSTLTTKQHVALDAAGGLALAVLAWTLTGKFVSHECSKPAHRSANL